MAIDNAVKSVVSCVQSVMSCFRSLVGGAKAPTSKKKV